MVYCWISILGPGEYDAYTAGVIARAGIGLQYGLPIAAGAAAWASRRRLTLSHPADMRTASRSSTLVLLAHLGPLLLSVVVGFGAVVILEVQRAVPQGPLDPTLLIPFTAMTVVALSVGWIMGSVLPTPLAVPISILAIAQWASYPLTDGTNVSWRNITGYATFMCCDFVEQSPDPRAVYGPVPIAVVLFIVAVLTVRIKMRYLALPAVGALAVSLLLANLIVAGSGPTASILRDSSGQVCRGSSPEVCLYPETPEDTQELIQLTLAAGYQHADEIGINLPPIVAAPSTMAPSEDESVVVGYPTTVTRDEALTAFTARAYDQLTCSEPAPPAPDMLPENLSVAYALAVVMGADEEAALPSVSFNPDESTSIDTAVSPAEVKTALGVSDLTEAVKVTQAWYQNQSACKE